MRTVTYVIPNISCGHCIHTIMTEVSELAGVSSVTASIENKQATITFDEPATEETIKKFLSEINYPVSE